MKNKLFLLAAVLGLLMIIAGFILSPSFIGGLTSSGKIGSVLRITQLQLAQIYLILFGFLLLIGAIIFYFLPKGKIVSQLLIGLFVSGILLTISGVIISPKFVEQNLSFQKFLSEGVLNYLATFQITIITFGCFLILISLLIYFKKTSIKLWLSFPLIVISTLTVYSAIMYNVYIKAKFPNNFLLKPKEFGKIVDLVLGREILLTDFEPQSSLIVERTKVFKAKYPVIDVHFHLASDFRSEFDEQALSPEFLKKSLDSVGVKTIVNLDGIDIRPDIVTYHKLYPNTFIDFAYPPLGSNELITNETLAALPKVVDDLVKRGAVGIGEWPKYLGISIKDTQKKLIPADDSRLDPFWAKMSDLKIPILWHSTDPTPFFQPVDRFNERFTELGRYPFWSYYKPEVPTKNELLKQQENVLKKHPELMVIGAHMGMLADNLKHLAYLFDNYPNYYVDCSATLSELGRQPFTAQKFFIKYQDRILFGSDGGALVGVKGWTVEKFFQSYFEFFETENEYIDYPGKGAINQGNWEIYGINLPAVVLEKIYYKNAERVFPNIFKSAPFVN